MTLTNEELDAAQAGYEATAKQVDAALKGARETLARHREQIAELMGPEALEPDYVAKVLATQPKEIRDQHEQRRREVQDEIDSAAAAAAPVKSVKLKPSRQMV